MEAVNIRDGTLERLALCAGQIIERTLDLGFRHAQSIRCTAVEAAGAIEHRLVAPEPYRAHRLAHGREHE